MADDLERYAAAGLFAGGPEESEARRSVVTWLTERGLDFDAVVDTFRDAEFGPLLERSIEQARRSLSIRNIADRIGVPMDDLQQVRVASGLPPVDPDAPTYSESDVQAFAVLKIGAEVFTWEELVSFIRVVGSSMARTAEAANSLYIEDVDRPMVDRGASGIELMRTQLNAQDLAGQLTSVLEMLLRLHLDLSIERTNRAFAGDLHVEPMASMVVGFVDLVGFTARSAAMTAGELADLVARFEALANDTVTRHGGRLVKLIGDELMFVAVTPNDGCIIGEALLREFGSDPALTPRGGIAYGPVLQRSGDYFGSTVNLAARLVDQAVPREILVTANIATATGRDLEPAGRRMLKGFVDPVAVASLTLD